MSNKKYGLFLALLFVFQGTVIAQPQYDYEYELKPIDDRVILDGSLKEHFWQEIEPVPLVMYEPEFGSEVDQKTVIKLAYDREYLYVGGQFYYNDLNNIRVNSLYRDRYSNDDNISIIIDPQNDNENARWLYVNPAGVQFDDAIFNDAENTGNGFLNSNWNTYWAASTKPTSYGWSVEIRIPFSSLGIKTESEKSEIGIIVFRQSIVGNKKYIFPAIPPNWSASSLKPSQAYDFTINNVESENPVYITPFITTGLNSSPQLNRANTGYDLEGQYKFNYGADLRYNYSDKLSLDVTYNTDFAQVESDDQVLNLSRIPLYRAEKRQFFQENASLFQFNLGQNNDLFFSRRIGLDMNGQEIPIYGGVRTAVRTNGYSIGFLNMQSEKSTSLPSENFGVLRVRKSTGQDGSYVGGIMTNRYGLDDTNRFAYGLDMVQRVVGQEYFTLRLSQDLNYNSGNKNVIDNAIIYADWTSRKNEGLSYKVGYTRFGSSFNPGIAFITRNDVTYLDNRATYSWFLPESKKMLRKSVQLIHRMSFRNTDGSLESFWGSGVYNLFYSSGARVAIGSRYRREDLKSPIQFYPGIPLSPKTYDLYDAMVNFAMNPGNPLRFNASFTTGYFYDGYNQIVTFEPLWNISRHLELGGYYEFNSIRYSDTNQKFDAHIARLRMQFAANKSLSSSAYVQFSNISEQLGVNFRLRYRFGEGRDLWLLYNENLNTSISSFESTGVEEPRVLARSILFKFNYTFHI